MVNTSARLAAVIAMPVVLAACSGGGDRQWVGSTTQPATSPTAEPSPPRPATTAIRLLIGDAVVTGELWDNAPGRALAARLPLTLEFRDFNEVEKVSPLLDPPLPMDGIPDGDDPEPRDIGWYAPSGDVVLYYGDVGYWSGIARIGRITSANDVIAGQSDNFAVTIATAS